MNFASEQALVHSMGQNGFKYLSTSGTATYDAKRTIAIQVISDGAVTCTSVRGDNLTAVNLQAGTIIVGDFTSVTVAGTGGAVLVYLAER